MKHRNNHFAVGYWSLIRRGRPTPDQADIDPKALKRLLPFVFLLDVRPATASFVYRLAGTTLCENYGGELRGRDFLAQWDRESRTKLPVLLKQSLAEAVPVCLSSVATTDDHRFVEVETVLMPMTCNAESRPRFLGVAQVLADVAPLMGHTIACESLVLGSLIRDGECPVIEAPAVAPVRKLRPSRTARGAHLTLVVSEPQPKTGHDGLRFDGNDALADLLARCEAEMGRGGRL